MSRWFRVYDDLVEDPKVQRLSPVLFRFLINLWCICSKNNGRLPSTNEIAFKLRVQERKVISAIKELTAAGLIDETDQGIEPHNWNKRQFKSDVSNERVKRHRERKCNVTETVTETPPDTDTDTELPSSLRSEGPAADLPEDKAPLLNGHDPPAKLDRKTVFYRRVTQLCGKNSGGIGTKLLEMNQGSVDFANRVLTAAAKTENPREYIGGVLRKHDKLVAAVENGDAR